MQLPSAVQRGIEEHADRVGFTAVKRAAGELSEAYRAGRGAKLSDPSHVAAYLVTRMPATYAATYSILKEVSERLAASVSSVLDVGSGTGAASLAARHWFPAAGIIMMERDAGLAEAARAWLPEARVVTADAVAAALPQADLVIAAYSVGELRQSITRRLWEAARVALMVVEPGTPAGFALIRSIRADLLQEGARMIAPCPGEAACPIVDPDWCHFAARVERSSLHRRLKDAALNYEDEKFSYVALAREAAPLAEARVVRRPHHQPGLVTIDICTPAGLRVERVSKRDREKFRRARKASWGDAW